jgi:nitrate/TMAO reductase-like tetraheme cytochrome c subunit
MTGELDAMSSVVAGLIVVDIGLLALLLFRRRLIEERWGKVLCLLAALLLPALAVYGAVQDNLRQSRRVGFCLSCHEMGSYGASLEEDDDEMIPAVHFQNRLVDRREACYDCHTDYTLFGPLQAKWTGVKHMYVHYFRGAPERLELYHPYRATICLHCHAGARSFESEKAHREGGEEEALARLRAGERSCMERGCHDVVHEVGGGGE